LAASCCVADGASLRSSCHEGFVFTCFLDYDRHIQLPPPACYHPNFVKLENLPYDNADEYVGCVPSPPGLASPTKQLNVVRPSTPSFSVICRPKVSSVQIHRQSSFLRHCLPQDSVQTLICMYVYMLCIHTKFV
jgi:hypothetical protein